MVKPVTVVVAQPKDGASFAVGYDTKVLMDGKPIPGIEDMEISFRPGEIITANIRLCVWPKEINGVQAGFYMAHPVSGDTREITAIEFVNGDRVEL